MAQYTHFLSETEWNGLIENDAFQRIDSVNEEHLRLLNEQTSLLFQTERGAVKIPYDRHQWSHSQKGDVPRHQPAYKKMVIQGCPTHSIRCTSVVNENFKKDIVHHGNITYYHYFLINDGVYWQPEEGKVKKPRITDDAAERLRDLLKQGSAKDAYELANSEGLKVSKRQCINQIRNVRSPNTEQKTRPARKKKEISLQQLEVLKRLFPDDVTIYRDANNLVHYQIKLFTSGKVDGNQAEEGENQEGDVEKHEYEPNLDVKEEEPDEEPDEEQFKEDDGNGDDREEDVKFSISPNIFQKLEDPFQ